MYIAEALIPLLRLGTFSWIMSHIVGKPVNYTSHPTVVANGLRWRKLLNKTTNFSPGVNMLRLCLRGILLSYILWLKISFG